MKRIEIILSICSGMQYLELDCKSCMQIEVLMKYILIQRMKRIANLYFSCFNIWDADENMKQYLKIKIDLEKFINHYTIQHIGNKIFLK